MKAAATPFSESSRSARSVDSDNSSHIKNMSIMRKQSHRDPLSIYEVLEILGEGSMGSVSRVRKRVEAVGGSARVAFVKQARKQDCCFGVFSFLKFPSQKDAFLDSSRSSLTTTSSNASVTSTGNGSSSSTPRPKSLYRKQSSLIKYGDQPKTVFYALKSIHLDRCSTKEYVDELKNEVAILKALDHPNVVRVIETFDYKNRMFLVEELCGGSDLYSREPYTEATVQTICKSLFSALSYLHSRGIVHRDLKFENIMFASKDSDQVKIIDFGLSQKFASDEILHDQVGTVYTMAPELLAGDYNEKADVWSLGVIAFMLLSSSMPFYGKDRIHVIKRILQGRYHFKARRWTNVSSEAKQFVTDCLTSEPKDRPSADEAQHSVWLQRDMKTHDEAEELEKLDMMYATMETYGKYTKLKQLALMVVAYKSTTEEIGHLRDIFHEMDTLKNGEIALPEFKAFFHKHYDYSDEELEQMFIGIDLDGTGLVHYIEFLASTIQSHGYLEEDRLAEAFDRLDCDDSGWITVSNLSDFLGEDVPTSYLDDIIHECDLEHDHRISYDEFMALWNEDDDVKYDNAHKRIQSRHSSSLRGLSTISSIDENLSLSQRTTDSSDLSTDNTTGSALFKDRKAMSVRGQWV